MAESATDCRGADTSAPITQSRDQGHDQARAAGPNRVADCDRPAIDVGSLAQANASFLVAA